MSDFYILKVHIITQWVQGEALDAHFFVSYVDSLVYIKGMD